MNNIYNLNLADWERIPETSSTRTLDYKIGCDDKDFVLVEAKETVFDHGNSNRNSRLENHIHSKNFLFQSCLEK
jgi:hypothetical protein